MKSLILIVSLFAISASGYAHTNTNPKACIEILNTFSPKGPLSEKLSKKLKGQLTVYVVVDLFQPIPNRGQKPALLVAQEKIEALGATLPYEYDIGRLPNNGLFTLQVRGTRAQIVNVAQLPQVVWVGLSNSPKTRHRIEKELARTKEYTRKRRDLEAGLITLQIAKNERAEFIDKKVEESEELQKEIEAVENDIARIESEFVSSQSSENDGQSLLRDDRDNLIVYKEQLEVRLRNLEREIARLEKELKL